MLTNPSGNRKRLEGPFLVAIRLFAEDTLLILPFSTAAGLIGKGVWDEYLSKIPDLFAPEFLTLDMVKGFALLFCFLVAVLLALGAVCRFVDTIRDSVTGSIGIFFGTFLVVIMVLLAIFLEVAIAIAMVSAWEGGG